MSPTEALSAAIDTWITLERQANEVASGPTRGYQWKALFLPEGTELRMTSCDVARYARVEGEHIVFEGRNVSPRGMTLAIAGEGRNRRRFRLGAPVKSFSRIQRQRAPDQQEADQPFLGEHFVKEEDPQAHLDGRTDVLQQSQHRQRNAART